MAICRDRIPYSHFMGGPNEWDEVSRLLALAWSHREGQRCGGCGQFEPDWLDGDGVEAFPRPAKLETDYCPSCADKARALKVRADELAEPGMRLIWVPQRAVHPAADVPPSSL